MPGFLAVWFLVSWLVGGAAAGEAPQPAPEPPQYDVQFALSILLYVAADYKIAVADDGSLISRSEYEEQVDLIERVEGLLGDPSSNAKQVLPQLEELRQAIVSQHPPRDIEKRVRDLRARVIDLCHIEVVPQEVPSLASGRILYAASCAQCHGTDGRAVTPQAQALNPPPANLLSPKLNANLSPATVFEIISFGIPNTAMASFETLEEAQRWDLAFYILALRHPNPPTDSKPTALRLTLRDLAHATDMDLARKLKSLAPKERAQEIARLRHDLPVTLGD